MKHRRLYGQEMGWHEMGWHEIGMGQKLALGHKHNQISQRPFFLATAVTLFKMDDDQQKTYDEFESLVNMQPKELERWLETENSKSVGISDESGSDESIGHKSGRRIIEIKKTKKADLDEDDLAHMSKVCGYIKRHSAQRPSGDVSETNWCYSLKNWGHDPTKK